jgi:hypothetical protein
VLRGGCARAGDVPSHLGASPRSTVRARSPCLPRSVRRVERRGVPGGQPPVQVRNAVAERLVVELAWRERVEDRRRDLAHLHEMRLAIGPTELVQLAHAGLRHEEGRAPVVLGRSQLHVARLEPRDRPRIIALVGSVVRVAVGTPRHSSSIANPVSSRGSGQRNPTSRPNERHSTGRPHLKTRGDEPFGSACTT